MLLFAIILILDLVLAWLIRRMMCQARRYKALDRAPFPIAGPWPHIAVVVPARNEAALIGRCIKSLLGQTYPADRLTLCIVDDGSTDGTGEIARETAGPDPRFRLMRGAALPQGWTGKSFACWQGSRAAGPADYLCFVDADTAAEPGLLEAAIAHAERRHVDMLSLEPFQELGSPAERVVMPCGFYLIAASQDLGRIQDPSDEKAAANGQFILIRSDVYAAIGGHAAVRSEVCEDTALAKRVKASRRRFALLGGERLIRTRMYAGWTSLWTGLSKNATELGGGPWKTVMIAGAGLLVASAALLLPVIALERVGAVPSALNIAAAILAFCGVASMVGLHVAGARHFRIPWVYGLVFPVGYALTFALALNSARLAWIGRVEWKGRTYLLPQTPADPASGRPR